MTDSITEMIDAVYDISADVIPDSYQVALWHSLVRHIPALEEDPLTGVIPLRTAKSEAGMLLPKRSKLVLRLNASLAADFASLSGQALDIGGATLQLGCGKLRKIQPYPTLHAHLVTGIEDEVAFLQDVAARLTELGILGKLLCGMRGVMHTPDHPIHGYSLVIHDLKPDDSLRLQYTGLGADRRYGCGIFVPYKVITDLD
ncbi:MAG: type I-MYXAN CRISPR-associated protein Cas6/Cmx6 [Gallionella sp.]|nr:type I-MYXAN CRISPR-associated protein Cas6/Cmx6 [Gallionella sp.]